MSNEPMKHPEKGQRGFRIWSYPGLPRFFKEDEEKDGSGLFFALGRDEDPPADSDPGNIGGNEELVPVLAPVIGLTRSYYAAAERIVRADAAWLQRKTEELAEQLLRAESAAAGMWVVKGIIAVYAKRSADDDAERPHRPSWIDDENRAREQTMPLARGAAEEIYQDLLKRPGGAEYEVAYALTCLYGEALATWRQVDPAREQLSDEDKGKLLEEEVLGSDQFADGLADFAASMGPYIAHEIFRQRFDPQWMPLGFIRSLLLLDKEGIARFTPTVHDEPSGNLPPNRPPFLGGALRRSNRKIALPWTEGAAFPIPNIQSGGTRNLGSILSGAATWVTDPSGGGDRTMAVLGNRTLGYVDLTPGEEDAERNLLQLLSPRAIKTMMAVSRLIYERTDHRPMNQSVSLTVGEIARAMGYKPGKDRSIGPSAFRNIAADVFLASKTYTWAADGPYDRKRKGYQSGWVAPLIAITAVHVKQTDSEGLSLPVEFDVMLGRNWAQATADTDFVQIAAGFMELTDESTIRLGWYYLTEFRYRMTKRQAGPTRKIPALCREACIDPGLPKNRARFLVRLEEWHETLHEKGVIGTYQRTPAPGVDLPPGRAFVEGEYQVTPPVAILGSYQDARRRALTKPTGRRQ